jgi:hypothetical protein
MSQNIESKASELFNKLRSRFPAIQLKDGKDKSTDEIENARIFIFDYVDKARNNFGAVTANIADEKSLKLFYGHNITHEMDREQRKEWFEFLRGMRSFAMRNLLTFDTRDIQKSNLEPRDFKQMTRDKDVFTSDEIDNQMMESRLYGTKKYSFLEAGETRIRILHDSVITDSVRGERSRHISKIFLETAEGERRLLPFKNVHAAEAMAHHVNRGGDINDERGQHICELVREMSAMKKFVNGVRRREFEDDETAEMTRAAVNHYDEVKRKLRMMRSDRGFDNYFETYTPEDDTNDDFDLNEIRERFVKKIYNDRFEEALPYVARAHKKFKTQLGEYGTALDEWAEEVTESTWAKPDNPDKIMALRELLKTPVHLGRGGEDAKAKIEPIIGDDDLINELEDMAGENGPGPDYDARILIKKWLLQHMPNLLKQIDIGKKNIDDAHTNWAQPVSPSTALGHEYGDAKGGGGDNSWNMTY